MKNFILILFVVSIAASCTSSQKYLEMRQYDMAIQKSAKKLMKNPDKDKQIDVLSRAWKAANQQDIERINYLKTTGQPEIWDEIFQIYNRLKWRQDIVRNLPQPVLSAIGFSFIDYTNETVNAQRNAAEFYYQRGINLLNMGDRASARQAYTEFLNTRRFFATYKDVEQQLIRAQEMGTANVLFISKNSSGQMLPEGFLEEILKVYLSDIETRFVRFFTNYDTSRRYHYRSVLNLTNVNVSPESVREIFYEESKEVQDGWNYVLDSNGNVMKDSLGNDIKTPKMVKITCRVREVQMHKQAIVGGFLDIYAADNTLLKSDPITAETFFDYVYAFADGDKSVLKEETRRKLDNPPMPFPDSFKMIWDASSIVKNVAKDALLRNSFLFQ